MLRERYMLSDYDSCPRIHLGLGRGDRHVAAEDESAPRLNMFWRVAEVRQDYSDHFIGGRATI